MIEGRHSAPDNGKQGSFRDKRSASRLAALQALYQLEIAGTQVEDVIEEFLAHRFGKNDDTGIGLEQDEAFFSAVVRGVLQHQTEIDRSLAGALSEGWTLARIDSILRALLRAAAFELSGRLDVPARVVIDEYVELARDFFEGPEPGFVNAVLDRLAREARPNEFGAGSSHDKPGF